MAFPLYRIGAAAPESPARAHVAGNSFAQAPCPT